MNIAGANTPTYSYVITGRYDVRPVVSLMQGIKIVGGGGTATDPWVVVP